MYWQDDLGLIVEYSGLGTCLSLGSGTLWTGNMTEDGFWNPVTSEYDIGGFWNPVAWEHDNGLILEPCGLGT